MALRSSRGVTLITVVIVMLTVALIGASLVEFVSSVNLTSQRVLDETKARYLAEAGIAQAIYILKKRAGAQGTLNEKIGPVALGDGSYTIMFDVRQALIVSIGTVNGISKKFQLQYNVF